jgi:hypothetical protein
LAKPNKVLERNAEREIQKSGYKKKERIAMARTLNENSTELITKATDETAVVRRMVSGPETHSFEGASPCQFCVLFEDQTAYELALETCNAVMDRCGAEFTFAFHFWDFNDLNSPASAQSAAEAVTDADIILFSMKIHELPPAMLSWLEACFESRTKAEGALALIVNQSANMNPVLEILEKRMRSVAHQLRMDFLPLIPFPTTPSAEVSARPSLALLDADPQPSWDHWGLNE